MFIFVAKVIVRLLHARGKWSADLAVFGKTLNYVNEDNLNDAERQ
jgi:hypothetical protein